MNNNIKLKIDKKNLLALIKFSKKLKRGGNTDMLSLSFDKSTKSFNLSSLISDRAMGLYGLEVVEGDITIFKEKENQFFYWFDLTKSKTFIESTQENFVTLKMEVISPTNDNSNIKIVEDTMFLGIEEKEEVTIFSTILSYETGHPRIFNEMIKSFDSNYKDDLNYYNGWGVSVKVVTSILEVLKALEVEDIGLVEEVSGKSNIILFDNKKGVFLCFMNTILDHEKQKELGLFK